MRTQIILADVPVNAIPCTLLFRAFGPGRYSHAEAVLGKNGWRYMIGDDCWVRGWGEKPKASTLNRANPFYDPTAFARGSALPITGY